jgi:hypothetical protein
VLAGGVVADRTRRHGEVAALGFGGTAALVLLVALVPMPDTRWRRRSASPASSPA